MKWQPGMPVPPALQASIMGGAQSLLDVLPRGIAITLNRVNLCVVPALGADVHGKYDSSSNTLFLAHDMIKNCTPEQMRVTLWHEMGHWLYDKAGGSSAHPRLKQWRADIEAHWQARIQGPTRRKTSHKRLALRGGQLDQGLCRQNLQRRRRPGDSFGIFASRLLGDWEAESA